MKTCSSLRLLFLLSLLFAATVPLALASTAKFPPIAFIQPYAVPLPITRFGGVTGLARGDFNGDGNADLACTFTNNDNRGRVGVLLGNGDGTFQPARVMVIPPTPAGNEIDAGFMIARDLDKDGKLDLVTIASDLNIYFYKGHGDGNFDPSVMTPTVAHPGNFQLADLNGDGKLDLGVIDGPARTVSVQLGNGDGTFGVPQSYDVGQDAADLAIGDLDGKNGPDLAVACYNANAVFTLLNKGDGTFLPAVQTSARGQAAGLYLADFDGDGMLDAVVCGDAGEVNYFRYVFMKGKGDGTFAVPADTDVYRTDNYPRRLGEQQTPDLNGDGKPDVAFIDINPGGWATVGINDGHGHFESRFIADEAGDRGQAYQLQFFDFNGDGAQDMATASVTADTAGGVSMILGDPLHPGALLTPRSFQSLGFANLAAHVTAMADFNGDHLMDLLTLGSGSDGDHFGLLRGASDGTLLPPVDVGGPGPNPGEFCNTLRLGDFNNDGLMDAMFNAVDGVQGGPPPRQIAGLGNGAGSIGVTSIINTSNGDAARNTVVADFNKDGRSDYALYIPGNTPRLEIWLSSTAGFSQTATLSLAPDDGNGLAFAASDFDNDGKVDIVKHIVSPTNRLLFFKGNGDGTFLPAVQKTSTLPAVQDIAAVDLNGDGSVDLLCATGDGVYRLTGNGNGTFGTPVHYGSFNAQVLGVADFDGDGKLDVAAAGGSGFFVLPGNGNGTFGAQIQFAFGHPTARDLTVGDINGDGRPEVVVSHDGTNFNDYAVLLNPELAVTSISPAPIKACAATTLVVAGFGFKAGASVHWNGMPLTTTFVSANQVKAALPAVQNALLPVYPGTGGITVKNPDGAVSQPVTIEVDEPKPIIKSLVPASLPAGSPETVLTVNGSCFLPGAVVMWNGTALSTTFDSDAKLQATIPSADLAAAGTATVNVVNPGGTVSTGKTFTVLETTIGMTKTAASRDAATNIISVTVKLTNTGHNPAQNLQITAATLGLENTLTTVPVNLGNVAAGAAVSATLTFSGAAGSKGQTKALTVSGTFTGGSFSRKINVVLP